VLAPARPAGFPGPLTATSEQGSGAPHLRVGWPLMLMFGGLIVWWATGLSGFVQAIFAIPIFITLVFSAGLTVPRWFGLWVGFLVFMLLSATQLKDLNNFLSWGWRASVYIGSTAFFLLVYNASKKQLPTRKLMNLLALFWVMAVIGGIAGMLLPNHSFHSVMEAVLPQKFLSNAFIRALVIPSTTGGKAFHGTGVYRVKAPFIYTNQWGSAFALTLPFAFAYVTESRRPVLRVGMIGLIILSIAPLVFSLDRGSWLSAGIGAGYGVYRLSRSRGRSARMARAARSLIVAGIVVVLVVLVSPLGSLILLRANNGYGDQHRLLLYSSSLSLIGRSPILGFGAPVSLSVINPSAPPGPSVGTHGTIWTILISNGVPALLFFAAWFFYLFFHTFRRIPYGGDRDPEAHFWCHVVILTAIVQFPYYELLPWGLPIAMICGAIALREMRGLPRQVRRSGARPAFAPRVPATPRRA
jgi:hypothetical protein